LLARELRQQGIITQYRTAEDELADVQGVSIEKADHIEIRP
jgi:hypothetical protein